MTQDFLNGFVNQWMRDNAAPGQQIIMTSVYRDPASNNILVRLGSEDTQERAILQTWMDDGEMAEVIDKTLRKLFPAPVAVAPRAPRRARFKSRRGPLSARHWMGA